MTNLKLAYWHSNIRLPVKDYARFVIMNFGLRNFSLLSGKSEAYSVLYDKCFWMHGFLKKLKFLPVIVIWQYLSLAGLLLLPVIQGGKAKFSGS